MCQRFGPSDEDYYYKKHDEPHADGPQDPEDNTGFTDQGHNSPTGLRKREANKVQKKSDLELKVIMYLRNIQILMAPNNTH